MNALKAMVLLKVFALVRVHVFWAVRPVWIRMIACNVNQVLKLLISRSVLIHALVDTMKLQMGLVAQPAAPMVVQFVQLMVNVVLAISIDCCSIIHVFLLAQSITIPPMVNALIVLIIA